MRVIEGDLFSVTQGAIGHGVNCRGVMGAGIAKPIKNKYPEMYAEYRELCRTGKLKPGGFFPWFDEESGLWVYNLASQDKPGADARLEWLSEAAGAALDHAASQGFSTVNIPRIGCGIGGLEWEDVACSLTQLERNRNGYFTVYVPPQESRLVTLSKLF